MSATTSGTMEQAGIAGTANGYGVLVLGDDVAIEHDGAEVAPGHVEGLGHLVVAAWEHKLGWWRFPLGARYRDRTTD